MIVLSVLTVSATATVLRDAGTDRPDPAARWLRQEWLHVSRWAKDRLAHSRQAAGDGTGLHFVQQASAVIRSGLTPDGQGLFASEWVNGLRGLEASQGTSGSGGDGAG